MSAVCRLGILAVVALAIVMLSAATLAQDDDSFAAELDGRKTWTIRYGLGSPLGLAGVGLSAGHISLDQTLAVDLRAEALSILTVEGHFDDRQPESLQSLTIYLDTDRLDGVFGDFTVEGLSGFSSQRRKMMGGRLDYSLGDATLTAVVASFEGTTESKTFIGQTADGEVVFSSVVADRPWITQPYGRGIDGLFAYPLDRLYVEEISTVRMSLPGSDPVRAVLASYGLAYLSEILGDEPETDLAAAAFTVIGGSEQTLLLNQIPTELIRGRLEEAVDAFNEKHELSGSDMRAYPFVSGSDYETSFLNALAAHTSIHVDGEDHPIEDAVQRRFYSLGRTQVLDASVAVEVSSDGIVYTSIARPEFSGYEVFVHSETGILEIDFPPSFFADARASIRVRFSYTVTGGSYMLGFSLVPGSERITVNDVPLTSDAYEIDYEIGLLILLTEISEIDVIRVEYERFGGGLGGVADYARYFTGLTLDYPLSDAVHLVATLQQGVDDADSVIDPERVRTMPNRQTVAGISGTVALDGLTGDFALGYGVDAFPPGDNERPASPNEVTAIAAGSGYLFVGHRSGLSVLHVDVWSSYGVSDGLSGRSVRAMVAGSDRVFIGTNAGLTVATLTGVAPLDRAGSWARYGEFDGLRDPSIRALSLRGDRLWIATDTELVSVDVEELDDPAAWVAVDLAGLDGTTALADGGDVLYVGTETGAYRFDPMSSEIDLLAGTGGLRIHALVASDGTLYVCSDRGLRAYREGVGTGWVEFGTPVYAGALLKGTLYYGMAAGMVRASDGARFYSEWRISALGVDEAGALWVGSRADAEYALMLWQRGEREETYDNATARIDGRDPTLFGEMTVDEHTTEGLFGRASFQHEAERFTLRGNVETISPGYRSIGAGVGGGTTGWEVDAAITPWDAVQILATHEYLQRAESGGSLRSRTANGLSFAGSFGPTISLSVRQESTGDDPLSPGPENASYVFQSSVADSLFDDVLDLSISWSASASIDRVVGTTQQENRLSAGAVLALPAGMRISIDWLRPLRSRAAAPWSGREEWSLGGDWSERFSVATVSADAVIELSRPVPGGEFDAVTAVDASLDVDSFEVSGWQITPTADATFRREDDSITLTGRAIARSAWEGLSIRTTLSGEASGLGDPVTRQKGRLAISVNYNSSPAWRPSLTYSADRSITIHEGVGSATATDHSLLGRSIWTGEGASDSLSVSVRVHETEEERRVTGSIENSYQLDLTESLAAWLSSEEMESGEAEIAFPTAMLSLDSSADYRSDGAGETPDANLTATGRLDVALSEMWGGALSASYLVGTKSSGGLYHSYLLEVTVSVDF